MCVVYRLLAGLSKRCCSGIMLLHSSLRNSMEYCGPESGWVQCAGCVYYALQHSLCTTQHQLGCHIHIAGPQQAAICRYTACVRLPHDSIIFSCVLCR